ncbi:leptomycin B resistance protein pmd1 [Venturia nashicola]|nr:leptomycin B resistance protein pmd1 [Venturia nashicola]
MEGYKPAGGPDSVSKYALPNQTLQDAELHSVPTSTGHEGLGFLGRESVVPSVNTSTTRPSSPFCWVLALCSVKNSPYFSLYGSIPGAGRKAILVAAILLSAAAGVPLPIIGYLFGKIINSFPPPEEELRARLIDLIGVAVAYFVITWGWAVCWGLVGEMISKELRKALVEKLLGMDQRYFDEESPDLTSILTNEIQLVQTGTSEKVGLFIQAISYFVAAFAVGFFLNARLTGILFAAVIPIMGLTVYLGNRWISVTSGEISDLGAEASTQAENALQNVQVVQAYGANKRLTEAHALQLSAKAAAGTRKAVYSAIQLGAIFFIAYAANALAFYVGYKQQSSNGGEASDAGTIYAVVFLILDASFVVGQFGPYLQQFATAAAAARKIYAILDRPSPMIDVYSEAGAVLTLPTGQLHEDIVLHNVSFSYSSRSATPALDTADLRISHGALTGIVGESGGGKSTIASLLMRLYDPSAGKIYLGERDIRAYNVVSWRKNLAYVPQDPILFPGTILDNIAFGIATSDLSETEKYDLCLTAAREAHCEFIGGLTDGMQTTVGSPGFARLSGGQKQRICLARALVRKPALLILDEYTSGLDSLSESKVIESLKSTSAKTGLTVVVIGHRLATVKSADAIAVMGNGRVVEQGSHDQLLLKAGPYQRLVDAQNVHADSGSESPRSQTTHSTSSDFTESDKKSESDSSDLILADISNCISKPKPHLGVGHIFKRCLSLSGPERLFMLIGLVASTIGGCILIGEAIVFGNLVQLLKFNSSNDGQHKDPQLYCLLFFVLALVALMSYSISGSAFGVTSERMVARIHDLLLQKLLRQDMAWFSQQGSSPQHLMAVLSTDVGRLKGLSGSILGVLLSATVSVCGGIILAHVVAWKIAIVLLPAVPFMLGAGFLRLKVLTLAEQRQQNAYSASAALASEACKQNRIVAAYGLEHHFSGKFDELVRTRFRHGLKFMLSSNILLAFSLAITYFVYALAYWWGARQVREGHYTTLDFFIVLPALLFSAQSAGQMFSYAPEITRAKAAARSVFNLLDEEPMILLDSPPASSLDYSTSSDEIKTLGAVEFRDVDFAYPSRPEKAILKRVNLNIPAGSMVGIVGASGSGKSSIMALMERFYDPTSGHIFLDGQDIRGMPASSLRARFGYVAQDSDLFAGTVAFNIGLGAIPGQTCSREDIIQTCKKCNIHDFILGLPDGYDTEIGNNGKNLSGGQRQRLAIARALIRDPEILLLDEPGSQLDALVEKDIREAIWAAAKGRTVIMVTHKLVAIKEADLIYVVEDGLITESGTHSELAAQGGMYTRMLETQSTV